jgi:hypothetical protein
MMKRGKIQKVMLGTLAVMTVVSLVLAAMAFATPAPASAAGPQRRWECHGYVCFLEPSCFFLGNTHWYCTNYCEGHGEQWVCFGESGCQNGC